MRPDSPTFSARLGAALALAVTVAVTTALAASGQRPAGRFDDRIRPREGGAMVVAPRALDRLAASDPLRVGWEEFGARHGGAWTVYLDERTAMPTLASGSGIEWFPEDELGTPGRATSNAFEFLSLEDAEDSLKATIPGPLVLLAPMPAPESLLATTPEALMPSPITPMPCGTPFA